MATDIGTILFVQILGMSQYPGSPFTSNIYRDLIMFLIVPTVFIIMVLYFASARVITDNRFRVMIGVSGYLFIIASGYYSAFALLAGPYFIFLIFILGLVGYIAQHFRRGGGFSGGGGFSSGEHHSGLHLPGRQARGTFSFQQKEYLKKKIEQKRRELQTAEDKGSKDRALHIQRQLDQMEEELYDMEHPFERR